MKSFMKSLMKFAVRKLLSLADIRLNGNKTWDMQVCDDRVFGEIMRRGSLGLGEASMNGWWSCLSPPEFFYRVLRARLDIIGMFNPVAFGQYLRDRFGNAATKDRAFEVGEVHYDLGNDFFQNMLDSKMVYSCAYWTPDDALEALEEAQWSKLDLVCRKLHLKHGQRLLDIGCGWGGLAKFAAEKYGVSVVGITISKEQAEFAREQCAGLPVEIRLQDYRDLNERFDCIASLGMFEHVERKNHGSYFDCVDRCLAKDGLFLLHTIGKDRGGNTSDPFTRKYIFPQGMIPVKKGLRRSIEERFSILDWHPFGSYHYYRTLKAWRTNFQRHWPNVRDQYADKLDGKFQRMWDYYLSSFAGTFKANRLDVWQIVMTKTPRPYSPVR